MTVDGQEPALSQRRNWTSLFVHFGLNFGFRPTPPHCALSTALPFVKRQLIYHLSATMMYQNGRRRGLIKPITRRGTASRDPFSSCTATSSPFDHDDKAHQGRRRFSSKQIKKILLIGLVASCVLIASSWGRGGEGGSDSMICGRTIGINLSRHKTWHTPYTPSLLSGPTNDKGGILLKNGDGFGGGLNHISCFFHAFDLSYDNKAPIYITKDAKWLWQILLPLFPFSGTTAADEKWAMLEKILGVTILESEHTAKLSGLEFKTPATNELFYYHSSDLTSSTIRNHRDTILRQLFQQSAGVCSGVSAAAKIQQTSVQKAKYTVMHLSPRATGGYLGKLNAATGRDNSAALEMTPNYIISILKPLGLLQNDVFVVGEHQNDELEVTRLFQDPDLLKVMKKIQVDQNNQVYLALLADAYLGNPADVTSMWIARMRYALGMKNTFILTEPKNMNGEGVWVSSVDDKTYLDMYNRDKLGMWMG